MSFFSFLRGIDINQEVNNCRSIPGAVLVDVRTPQEYQEGHIPDSINIPLQALNRIGNIIMKKDTPVYVYCYSGSRSRHAAGALGQMGYSNVHNAGGISSYTGKMSF